VLEPSVRAPYTNVNRWFTTLINQQQFKKVLGDVKLCDKAITLETARKSIILIVFIFVVELFFFMKIAKKAAETSAKKDKKEKGGKQEKAPKQEAAPELPDEEDDPPLEPKSKDPFEAFPKGFAISKFSAFGY